MDYAAFAADLPPDGKVTFESVEENEEELRRLGVEQEMRQLGPGMYRCDLAVRSLEGCDLVSDRFNKAISMHLEPPSGTVGFLFPRSISGNFLTCGENVANNKLLFFPALSGADITIPALAGADSFLIPEQRFIEISQTLCPAMDRPESLVAIGGSAAQLNLLRSAVVALIANRKSEYLGGVSVSLIETTIVWMADSVTVGCREDISRKSTRARIARLSREFIDEHYRQDFRMEAVCGITGVGVRSLQRAFRDYFGITVTDYLKALRLSQAHRDLMASDPSSETVSGIALRHGFTHLGRFSAAFHEQFGKLPRETLARIKDVASVGSVNRT